MCINKISLIEGYNVYRHICLRGTNVYTYYFLKAGDVVGSDELFGFCRRIVWGIQSTMLHRQSAI